MEGWYRRRSAPLEALLASAIALIVTVVVCLVFYISVVRGARGRPAFTAGIPPARVMRPLQGRAVYAVTLDGPLGRETPTGAASTIHQWRVVAPSAPDDPLCEGSAYDSVVAIDDTGVRAMTVAIPPAFFISQGPEPVPPRVLATCPQAFPAIANHGALEYFEDFVPRGIPAEVVGCVDRDPHDAPIAACDDGAPSRVYPRSQPMIARAHVRGAMFKIAQCAGAFMALCFAAGLLALRRFDRSEGEKQ